jgi:hypothetical protein
VTVRTGSAIFSGLLACVHTKRELRISEIERW